MTYQQAAFVLFASLMFAGRPGQAPTAPTPPPAQAPAAKNARRPGSREVALLAKLKALLEPVGIAVEKSALVDAEKVKVTNNLVIKWDVYPEILESTVSAEKVKNRPAGKGMQVLESKKVGNSLPRLYGFDLTGEDLFVAAVDAESRLKWWGIERSVGIIRGEAGHVYYQTAPHLHVSLPDDEKITEIRIFKPVWTGTEFILEHLATLPSPH